MESSTGAGHSPGLDGTAGHGVDGAAADGANGQRWRQVFAGEEHQLGYLRRWLASLLPPLRSARRHGRVRPSGPSGGIR
jgi:hypothetical protein